MGVIVTSVRVVAVCAAGLALAGCATIIPFQSRDEVIVRVADKPDIYPARAVAGSYAPYAVLAALAYQDANDISAFGHAKDLAKKKVVGWRRVPLPPVVCPLGRICAGEVGEQLWIRSDNNKCQEAVVVFRGTVSSSVDDWIANLHWFHRVSPIYDYYEQARDNIPKIVAVAERQGCAGRIIAVGHSLGGGLAQHVAYAHPKIQTVYAFDPTFVIGTTDFSLLGLPIHNKDRYFDYVYEHGEILAFPRFIARLFHPYEACNPRIRTVRFNTLSGTIFNQHRIAGLANNLVGLSQPPAPPDLKQKAAPPPRLGKTFDQRARCPVST